MERELKEEIGDDVKIKINPRPVAMGRHLVQAHLTMSKEKDLHVLYLFFEAEYLSGEVAISAEHESYRWVDLAQEDIASIFTSGILEGVRMYLL
ncbi:MAG: NUDIX domain-containing protein [Parcubacteria group bacterium]|nr:NUDIX domain-containing protein [Parcubacteria group bacterium]